MNSNHLFQDSDFDIDDNEDDENYVKTKLFKSLLNTENKNVKVSKNLNNKEGKLKATKSLEKLFNEIVITPNSSETEINLTEKSLNKTNEKQSNRNVKSTMKDDVSLKDVAFKSFVNKEKEFDTNYLFNKLNLIDEISEEESIIADDCTEDEVKIGDIEKNSKSIENEMFKITNVEKEIYEKFNNNSNIKNVFDSKKLTKNITDKKKENEIKLKNNSNLKAKNNQIRETSSKTQIVESFEVNRMIKNEETNKKDKMKSKSLKKKIINPSKEFTLPGISRSVSKSSNFGYDLNPIDESKVEEEFTTNELLLKRMLDESDSLALKVELGRFIDGNCKLQNKDESRKCLEIKREEEELEENYLDNEDQLTDDLNNTTFLSKKWSCSVITPMTKRFKQKNMTFTDSRVRNIECENQYLESRIKNLMKNGSGISQNSSSNFPVLSSSLINRRKLEAKTCTENLKIEKKLREIKKRVNRKAPWSVPVWI